MIARNCTKTLSDLSVKKQLVFRRVLESVNFYFQFLEFFVGFWKLIFLFSIFGFVIFFLTNFEFTNFQSQPVVLYFKCEGCAKPFQMYFKRDL